MKRLRNIITLICIATSFVAHAGEPPGASGKGDATQPVAADLQRLQGTWKGVMVGQEKDGPITITISSNSLHFHRDANFWFETTFTLPGGTDPKQLRATIKDCASGKDDSVGKVVGAIFKIENGTLTLVPLGNGDDDTPKSFDAAEEKGLNRYELREVPRKGAEPVISPPLILSP